MGRLEKIVVLTVLFLVAVVLGVALTPTDTKTSGDSGRGPLDGALDPDQAAKKAPGEPGVEKDRRLLNAEVEVPKTAPEAPKPAPQPLPQPPVVSGDTPPAGPDATPKPVPQPPAPYLVTTEGLLATGMADTMLYAWQQGDTFAALAQRYYGSKDKVSRLTKANEGRAEATLAVGEKIWVPVAESAKTDALAGGEKIYVVKKGDMLSGISQQYYGTAKKWQKILDANRDTLSSPEKLQPGMKLRIPE
jgi:nucleoid-associated protein YgaU